MFTNVNLERNIRGDEKLLFLLSFKVCAITMGVLLLFLTLKKVFKTFVRVAYQDNVFNEPVDRLDAFSICYGSVRRPLFCINSQ